MEDQMRKYTPFEGKLIYPPGPPPNTPNCLDDKALMALPFIGIYVGVDDLVPSKAVYTLYEPQTCSLRFVHGDGTFTNPEGTCFIERFVNASSPQSSPASDLLQKLRRSSLRYHEIMNHKGSEQAAEVRNQFPTTNSVKCTLSHISDLKFGILSNIPAMQIYDMDDLAAQVNSATDARLCVTLPCNPKWDFNPTGFQALITEAHSADWATKHTTFIKNYNTPLITFDDFQQALYCLAGMQKVGLVTFVQVSQNDPCYFVEGMTPSLPPKEKKPLQTTNGWTVDDFVIRFAKWEGLRDSAGGLVRWLDPARWLEAELDWEERKSGRARPTGDDAPASSVSWEELIELRWIARGGVHLFEYPRPFVSVAMQPFQLRDIICPRTGKKSERAKKELKDREKQFRKAETARETANVDFIDLTADDDLLVGHTNPVPVANARSRSRYGSNHRSIGGYNEYESESAYQPVQSKRQRSPSPAGRSHQTYHYGVEPPRSSDRLMSQRSSYELEEMNPRMPGLNSTHLASIEEDLYGVSDEDKQRRARKRARQQPRSPSPLPQFEERPVWEEDDNDPFESAVSTPRKTLGNSQTSQASTYTYPYPTPSKSSSSTKLPQRGCPLVSSRDRSIPSLGREFSILVAEHAPRYFEETPSGRQQHYSALLTSSATFEHQKKTTGGISTRSKSRSASFKDDSDETDEEIMRIENPAFLPASYKSGSKSRQKPKTKTLAK